MLVVCGVVRLLHFMANGYPWVFCLQGHLWPSACSRSLLHAAESLLDLCMGAAGHYGCFHPFNRNSMFGHFHSYSFCMVRWIACLNPVHWLRCTSLKHCTSAHYRWDPCSWLNWNVLSPWSFGNCYGVYYINFFFTLRIYSILDVSRYALGV